MDMANRLGSVEDVELSPGSIAASGPHCGVCEHVTFEGDWERTPHCSYWEQSTSIVVGRVCDEFDCMSVHHVD